MAPITIQRTRRRVLSGDIFGRLTAVMATNRRHADGSIVWNCACSCGRESLACSSHLLSGHTKSCGCLSRDAITTHGATAGRRFTPAYSSWDCMMQRCYNPNSAGFQYYGGRGIGVCEQWHTFDGFLADMGERSKNLSLERIDGNKGYGPDNCKWATRAEQARNTSRNRMLTLNSTTMCIQDWCLRTGLSRNTINGRIRLGWSDERILTTPRL